MGEMDNNLLQFFYNGKPIRQGDFGCGHITKPSPTHADRMASLKAEMDAMTQKHKPIADKLVEEIYESYQKPMELLTKETAQQINKAFENIRVTMGMASPKRKARKYYKPKFTL